MSIYKWSKAGARERSALGNSEMGCASSARKCRTTSACEVRAPSHCALAGLVPVEKSVIRYPRAEEFFSRITAEEGSSKPVRYQKSEDWRNL